MAQAEDAVLEPTPSFRKTFRCGTGGRPAERWVYGSVTGGIPVPSWGVRSGSGLLFAGESRRHCVLVRLNLARVRDRIPLQRVDQFGRTSEVCPGVVP